MSFCDLLTEYLAPMAYKKHCKDPWLSIIYSWEHFGSVLTTGER